jgi:hypothetical protein
MGKRKELAVKPISSEDLAWFVGLFEGEGDITRNAKKSWRLRIGMSDEDVIRRVHDLVGVGNVWIVPAKDQRKTHYVWAVTSHNNVVHLLTLMLPRLGKRRSARALEALLHLSE